MTAFSLLSLLCRLCGFAQLAERFYAKHEEKVAKNVRDQDYRLSDDDISKRVREYYRD